MVVKYLKSFGHREWIRDGESFGWWKRVRDGKIIWFEGKLNYIKRFGWRKRVRDGKQWLEERVYYGKSLVCIDRIKEGKCFGWRDR